MSRTDDEIRAEDDRYGLPPNWEAKPMSERAASAIADLFLRDADLRGAVPTEETTP